MLASNIHRLLTDQSKAQSLADTAFEYVHAHHSCETMTSRYLALFESMGRK
jgi:spore maturation protein CgeB